MHVETRKCGVGCCFLHYEGISRLQPLPGVIPLANASRAVGRRRCAGGGMDSAGGERALAGWAARQGSIAASPQARRARMTLYPQAAQDIGPVPSETARVARAAFPQGNVYLRVRDEVGVLYADQTFAPLFSTRGRP